MVPTQPVYDRLLGFLGLESFALPDLTPQNVGTEKRSPNETVEALRNLYRPHNEALYKLIGADLGWR